MTEAIKGKWSGKLGERRRGKWQRERTQQEEEEMSRSIWPGKTKQKPNKQTKNASSKDSHRCGRW